MRIGVPKEIKPEETRVAITTVGVRAFVAHGHEVLIETGAGSASGITDDDYRAAGAEIRNTAESVWRQADMIMKVKEPIRAERAWLRDGLIVYAYLHLAAAKDLAHQLVRTGTVGIAYETIQLPDGSLPLLIPMSEVAGRLAIQVGSYCLETPHGGKGILLSGVSGVRPANVAVLGAGTAGTNACQLAVGLGANVTVLDINPSRLRYVRDILQGHITTLMANRANIERTILAADLIIGAVLVPGARAPHLIRRDHVACMQKGSVIVDVTVDQGGCCETTRPTTHADPTYLVDDVVHYCVANMPALVPHTATYALTNTTLSYGLEIADVGLEQAMANDDALKKGVNTYQGRIVCAAVAEALGETPGSL